MGEALLEREKNIAHSRPIYEKLLIAAYVKVYQLNIIEVAKMKDIHT